MDDRKRGSCNLPKATMGTSISRNQMYDSRRQGDDDEHADKIAGPSRGLSQERKDQVTERNMIEIVAIRNAAEEIQYAA